MVEVPGRGGDRGVVVVVVVVKEVGRAGGGGGSWCYGNGRHQSYGTHGSQADTGFGSRSRYEEDAGVASLIPCKTKAERGSALDAADNSHQGILMDALGNMQSKPGTHGGVCGILHTLPHFTSILQNTKPTRSTFSWHFHNNADVSEPTCTF